MSTLTTDCESWIGSTLVDGERRKLGRIEEIYYDEQSDRPQWMVVRAGRFGTRHSFVPLAGARPAGSVVSTPIEKRTIDEAPKVDFAEDVPDEQVVELYRYYGMPYQPADADVEPFLLGPSLTERVLSYVG